MVLVFKSIFIFIFNLRGILYLGRSENKIEYIVIIIKVVIMFLWLIMEWCLCGNDMVMY